MIDETVSPDVRQAKLEKQLELLRKKQRQKHAHQMLSLQARCQSADASRAEKSPRKSEISRRMGDAAAGDDTWAPYAYDGPQSYELSDPDGLCPNEVQVIRVNSQFDNQPNSPPESPSFFSHLRNNGGRTDKRKQYSVGALSTQDSEEMGITRSSTVLSSLDQDGLLLSESEDESDDKTPMNFLRTTSNLDETNTRFSCNHSAESSKPKNSTITTHKQSLPSSAGLEPQPLSRVIDWCANLSPVHDDSKPEQPVCVGQSLEPNELRKKLPVAAAPLDSGPKINVVPPPASPGKTGKTTPISEQTNDAKPNASYTQSTEQVDGKCARSSVDITNPQMLFEDEEEIKMASYKRGSQASSIGSNLFDPTENLEEFILQPGPQGNTIRCRITRDKRGVDRGLFPTYYLHMEQDDRKFFLLAARRRKRSATSNYVISCDATNLSRNAECFAGKLRSNFLGTHFILYGGGKRVSHSQSRANRSYASVRSNERGGDAPEDGILNSDASRELAVILYDTNVLGFKGPRRMTVLIPELTAGSQRVEFGPNGVAETMLEAWKQKSTTGIMELHNKSPVWNEDTQSYVLNFYGRVTQASVKNFQIVHDNDSDYVIMQFGRIADDVFTMDYAYPMCALQAFGIAISSFDGKLAYYYSQPSRPATVENGKAPECRRHYTSNWHISSAPVNLCSAQPMNAWIPKPESLNTSLQAEPNVRSEEPDLHSNRTTQNANFSGSIPACGEEARNNENIIPVIEKSNIELGCSESVHSSVAAGSIHRQSLSKMARQFNTAFEFHDSYAQSNQTSLSRPDKNNTHIGKCICCGKMYSRCTCPHRKARCSARGRIDHLHGIRAHFKRCRVTDKRVKEPDRLEEDFDSLSQAVPDSPLGNVCQKIFNTDGESLNLIFDTASVVSIISQTDLVAFYPSAVVIPKTTIVKGITGHSPPVVGSCALRLVIIHSGAVSCQFLVFNSGPPILGLKIPLEDMFIELTTISIPFGLSVSSAIFQDAMNKLFLGFVVTQIMLDIRDEAPSNDSKRGVTRRMRTSAGMVLLKNIDLLKVTGHEAFEFIYGPKMFIGRSSAAMVQSWNILLSVYNYNIEHRNANQIPHVDFLSRHSAAEASLNSDCLQAQPPSIHPSILIWDTRKYLGSAIIALRKGWNFPNMTRTYTLNPLTQANQSEQQLINSSVIPIASSGQTA
ncbi:unnamed protein product [Calicophoron daubneyi]|uniref:Tubby C-terminal domain-containing protein n=1 Tax=Calicophoron daubneyi TaxID=300641 RepID=A0AAV2T2V4_CALDB